MDKPVVALFDFDGTITRSDTLPLFMRHATGWVGLVLSILSVLPAMLLLACNGWKSVGGIDAADTKTRLLRRSFKGKRVADVEKLGSTFIPKVQQVIEPAVMQRLRQHIEQGHQVAIVSASIDTWVRPWAMTLPMHRVIATRMQQCDGIFTGLMDGPNCNGEEKVRRIAEYYNSDDYYIVAYGNSSGDYPMFNYAHEAYMCNKGIIKRYK